MREANVLMYVGKTNVQHPQPQPHVPAIAIAISPAHSKLCRSHSNLEPIDMDLLHAELLLLTVLNVELMWTTGQSILGLLAELPMLATIALNSRS